LSNAHFILANCSNLCWFQRGDASSIRLPKSVVPSRYRLQLAPNLDTGDVDGQVHIDIRLEQAVLRDVT
jgi:hypothetical protein